MHGSVTKTLKGEVGVIMKRPTGVLETEAWLRELQRSLSGTRARNQDFGLYEPGVGQPFPVLSSLPSQASSGSRMGLN